MKTQRVAQAKSKAEPASMHAGAPDVMQHKTASTPRQASQAAHIAQLKGEAKPKGKMPPPKKAKGS